MSQLTHTFSVSRQCSFYPFVVCAFALNGSSKQIRVMITLHALIFVVFPQKPCKQSPWCESLLHLWYYGQQLEHLWNRDFLPDAVLEATLGYAQEPLEPLGKVLGPTFPTFRNTQRLKTYPCHVASGSSARLGAWESQPHWRPLTSGPFSVRITSSSSSSAQLAL